MPSTAIDTATLTTSGFPPTNKSLQVAVGTVLLADINAGYTIVPAVPGRTLRPIGVWVRSNGAFAACTDVRIGDTAGTPVVVAQFAVANLTDGAILTDHKETGVTLGAGFFAQCTADKGLQIYKTGSTATTATSLDFRVEYVVV